MFVLWWLVHRLAHVTGWNRCRPEGDGYTCVGCGEHTPWRAKVDGPRR